jgi:hypothetical protein
VHPFFSFTLSLGLLSKLLPHSPYNLSINSVLKFQQSLFLKTEISFAADNNMIKNPQTKDFGGSGQTTLFSPSFSYS